MASGRQHQESKSDRDGSHRLEAGFSPRYLPVDAAVLTVLLGSFNLIFAANDPGWIQLNPSPWFLLPLYLGCRYGLPGGITGAILAAAATLGLHLSTGSEWSFLGERFGEAPFFFLGILVTAAASSGVHFLLAGRVKRVQAAADGIAAENLRLREENALFRENEADLQESLLLHGAEYASLTDRMAVLFGDPVHSVELGLLELFSWELGVDSAAIYVYRAVNQDDGGSFSQVAVNGDAEFFPPAFSPGQSTLVDQAILQGKIVATPLVEGDAADPGAGGGEIEPFLAVIPWGTRPDQTEALCVIRRMDFERISWESLARVEAVFDWAMARRPHQAGGDGADSTTRVLGPFGFCKRYDQARTMAESLNLDSRVVIFAPAAESVSVAEQNRFVDSLQSLVRDTDCLGAITSLRGDYALGLLTLARSDRAAELYANRLLERSEIEGIGFKVYGLFDPMLEAALEENRAGATGSGRDIQLAPGSELKAAAEPARVT